MEIRNIDLDVETTGLAEAARLLSLDINGKKALTHKDKVFMLGIIVYFYNDLDKINVSK